jgi:hypothetical protein
MEIFLVFNYSDIYIYLSKPQNFIGNLPVFNKF